MSLLGSLVSFGLRQVLDASADGLVGWVEERFTDHSGTLSSRATLAPRRKRINGVGPIVRVMSG